MNFAYQRSELTANFTAAFSSPQLLANKLSDSTMPEPLVDWLAKLQLLHGVPFNYLVPDEGMLPPESIRFFYLDANWIAAMNDGAMSIGRNLNANVSAPDTTLQAAILPSVNRQLQGTSGQLRARAFGTTAAQSTAQVISGFLLRSAAVLAYPTMGVNVYPKGGTPDTSQPQLLKILRFEQLGPKSDTLICLVDGDAYRVDLHEAPQALHYGIDCFDQNVGCQANGKPAIAIKHLYTFGNTTTTTNGTTSNVVTMSKTVTATDISSCLRTTSPRVLGMDALSKLVLAANKAATPPPGTTAPTSIDSSEMGFEMTQGVGMVSFYKSGS